MPPDKDKNEGTTRSKAKPWTPEVVAGCFAAVAGTLTWRAIDAIQTYSERPLMFWVYAIPAAILFGLAAYLVRERVRATIAPALARFSIPSPVRYWLAPWRMVGIVLCIAVVHIYLKERNYDCYVTPRRLTADQISSISESLLAHDPYDITITYSEGDSEVYALMTDFRAAFQGGNWRVNEHPVNPIGIMASIVANDPDDTTRQTLMLSVYDAMRSGVSVVWKSGLETQQQDRRRRPQDPRNPGEIAQEAWNAANIRGSSGYSLAPGLALGEYSVELVVGRRPLSTCNQ